MTPTPPDGKLKKWFAQQWHCLIRFHQAVTFYSESGKVYRGCAQCEWGDKGVKKLADSSREFWKEIFENRRVPQEEKTR